MTQSKSSRLSERYLAALRLHFEQGTRADLQAAHELGARAVALGLETLDLARMHDHALVTLLLPRSPSATRYDMATRAALFFSEAIAPIEKTHRLAVKAGADFDKLEATLTRHTQDLADSNNQLLHEITQREAAGLAVRTSQQKSTRLLQKSHQLREKIQTMARRILTVHEDQRRKMSLGLHDEIAQTLLGIQIRLLALNKGVSDGDRAFKKEIAITQRLVEKSVRTIDRFASELGTPS